MKANALIDWLTFTVRCAGFIVDNILHSSTYADVLYVITDILRLPAESFTLAEYGRYGYRQCYVWQGIEILFDAGNMNMGVCVSMSGNACRSYEHSTDPNRDMVALLRRLHGNEDVNITRIDLAADDKAGHLDLMELLRHLENGEVRSRISKFNKNESGDIRRPEAKARSIYIGSQKSDLRFRIYDKAKEQGDFDGVWNRVEMVCRHDYAAAAVNNIVTSGLSFAECVAGMIAEKIAFIVMDDVNISRCSLAQWWSDFLEEVKRIVMVLKEKPKLKAFEKAEFLENNMAATVAVCVEIFGPTFLTQLYKKGRKKLRDYHEILIRDGKEELMERMKQA